MYHNFLGGLEVARIQFNIPDCDIERFERYEKIKHRHKFGEDAFYEKLKRLESKDSEIKLRRKENLKKSIAPILKDILREEGLL
jgi:hypothetical protein